MSKKKKKSKPKKSSNLARPEVGGAAQSEIPSAMAEESRSAVAANVAWMLALIATLMAEGIGLVCRWYTTFVQPVELLTVLSAILLLVAFVSGIMTLAMIPVVHKLSKVRPPQFITQLAVLAGGLPLIVVMLQTLRA